MIVVTGGMNLNFVIKDSATAPASPKENTIWINTSTEAPSWDMAAEQPLRRSSTKNLLCYPFKETTHTESGITFTDNADGTVTVKGTSTAQATFLCCYKNDGTEIALEAGTYVLSGTHASGTTSTFSVWAAYSYDNWKTETWVKAPASGYVFTLTKAAKIRISIVIASGQTVGGLIFRPQLEKAAAATSFVMGTAEGQLWLETKSGDITVNALKRGGLWLKLGGCKQYINGAWTDKVAQIYQGGAWTIIENTLVLFNGTDNTAITGGWTATGNNVSASSVTIANGKMTFKNVAGASDNGQWFVGAVNKIDLTDYKTFRVTIDSLTATTNTYIGISTAQTYSAMLSEANYKAVSGAGTYELDISKLSGAYYVGFASYQNTNTDYTAVFSAWELNK